MMCALLKENNMHTEYLDVSEYLETSEYIDWQHPEIQTLSKQLATQKQTDAEIAKW